jgi:hypothetical protein
VSETAERRAQQFIAASYFVLAADVAVESVRTLVDGHHPETKVVQMRGCAPVARHLVVISTSIERSTRAPHERVEEGPPAGECAQIASTMRRSEWRVAVDATSRGFESACVHCRRGSHG